VPRRGPGTAQLQRAADAEDGSDGFQELGAGLGAGDLAGLVTGLARSDASAGRRLSRGIPAPFLRRAVIEILRRVGASTAEQLAEGPPGPPSLAVAERTVSAATVVLVGCTIVPARADPCLA